MANQNLANDDTIVKIGSIVTFTINDSADQMTLRLVYGTTDNHEKEISTSSKIGKAINGKRLGEKIKYIDNINNEGTIEILDVK